MISLKSFVQSIFGGSSRRAVSRGELGLEGEHDRPLRIIRTALRSEPATIRFVAPKQATRR